MSHHIDPSALTGALQRLDGARLESRSVEEALEVVVSTLVRVFGVSGCGIMLVDGSDALRYVAASDESGRILEKAQEELGYGPCVDSLVYDEPYETVDLVGDERWPGLGEIVAPAGVRAVLGVPVKLGGIVVGSLNVYRDEPHQWDESERNGLRAFDRLIEAILVQAVFGHRQEQVVSQLEYALEQRVQIERAIGLVMGRRGVDAVAAFNVLRRYARARRMRVADAAAQLLAGDLADLL